MTTDKSDKHSRLVARLIAGLSADSLDRQVKHEYHQGHPTLNEAEIELMFKAEKVLGRPSRSLDEAKKILGIPAQKQGYSSVAALVMARTMQRFAEKYPDHDPDMMADAIEFEKRALAAIKLGQSELFPLEKPAALQLRLPGL